MLDPIRREPTGPPPKRNGPGAVWYAPRPVVIASLRGDRQNIPSATGTRYLRPRHVMRVDGDAR